MSSKEEYSSIEMLDMVEKEKKTDINVALLPLINILM